MIPGADWSHSHSEGGAVTTINIDAGVTPGDDWCAWALLRSDIHHDNPNTNWAAERRVMEEAVRRNAAIIDCGDSFCAMQGKYDKRSSHSKCREVHRKNDYLGALLDEAARFYEPYAHNIVRFGHGNHETSQIDKHGIDLSHELATRLNTATGSDIHGGHYTGWVNFRFTRGNQRQRLVMWYIHGYGGGGQVTADMIQASRQAVYIDADIIASGHTHDHWNRRVRRARLTRQGKIEVSDMVWAKIGTGKDAYKKGKGGWEVERGHPPKPCNLYWLKFTWSKVQKRFRVECQDVFWE